jgi:hypothetical protein
LTNQRYWLLEWMQSNELKEPCDVERLLSERYIIAKLGELADSANQQVGDILRTNNAIIGGRGLDLSAEPTGAGADELVQEVDRIFGTVWHYFDEIVVEGFAPRRFMLMCRDGRYDLAKECVLTHCRLLLHLNAIGALDSVVFHQKPDPCTQHGNDNAVLNEAGLARILDDELNIVVELERGELIAGEFHHGPSYERHFHYEYEHPLIGRHSGTLAIPYAEEELIKRAIAQDLFLLYAENLAADVATSRVLSAPLAVSLPLHEALLGGITDRLSSNKHADEVAIELGLPILHGITARDLIKIRNDEADAFERFRSGLRAAINERVQRMDSADDATRIAAAIVDEFIVPGLHDIDQRLEVARKVLSRKSTVNIAVGTVAVIAGLLAGIPLLLPAGIAVGLAAPGVHYTKFLEEKGQLELSDMYFLWNLQQNTK